MTDPLAGAEIQQWAERSMPAVELRARTLVSRIAGCLVWIPPENRGSAYVGPFWDDIRSKEDRHLRALLEAAAIELEHGLAIRIVERLAQVAAEYQRDYPNSLRLEMPWASESEGNGVDY